MSGQGREANNLRGGVGGELNYMHEHCTDLRKEIPEHVEANVMML